MSDYCDNCNEEIIFRYSNGSPQMYHLSGGCGSGKYDDSIKKRPKATVQKQETSIPFGRSWSKVGNTYQWKYAHHDLSRSTVCPICGQTPVYFVRHNGGCAWFDALGKPWPKHPCFDTVEGQPQRSSHESSYNRSKFDLNCTEETFRRILPHGVADDCLGNIGVIISSTFSERSFWDVIEVATLNGGSATAEAYSSMNTMDVIGELVWLDFKKFTIKSLTHHWVMKCRNMHRSVN